LEREKELGELKSRFVSMASHEFRTPLTSILSSAEILTRYRQKMEEPYIEQKLTVIQEQVGHLTDIIDDVLNLGRIQSGQAEFKPVELDVDQFCRAIIDEFQIRSDHQIMYRCEYTPVILRLDKKLMREVITNLITNAIKYSPNGKSIYVTVEVSENGVNLCVR